jgi:hypothetical protein
MRPVRMLALLATLMVLPPLTATAGAMGGGHYQGTGDRANFRVEFGRHAHTTEYEVLWDAPCNAPNTEDGRGYGTDSTPGEKQLRVGRHGRFRMHRHFTNPWQSEFDIHFAGRLRRNGASGTFWATSTTPPESGNEPIVCKSGRVHWTARRR